MSNLQATAATPRRISQLVTRSIKVLGLNDQTAAEKLKVTLDKMTEADRAKVNEGIQAAIAAFKAASGQDSPATVAQLAAQREAAMRPLIGYYRYMLGRMRPMQVLAEADRALPNNERGRPFLPWNGQEVTPGWDTDVLRLALIENRTAEFESFDLADVLQSAAEVTAQMQAAKLLLTDAGDIQETEDPELAIIDNRWSELDGLDKEDIIKLLLIREFDNARVTRYYAEYE